MSLMNSTLKMLSMLTMMISVLLLVVTSFRLLLPYSYLVLLCIYAIAISLVVILSSRNRCGASIEAIMIASVIIFALLLRSLYMLRTNFSVEPLYDGYKDIVVSYLFLKHKHAYIVRESPALAYASSFPVLDILAALIANVLGIKVLKSAISLSLAIGFCIYLIVILFAKHFMKSLQLKRYFMILVFVLGSIWPELIYMSIVFYPRYFCLALYCLLMYFIFVLEYISTEYLLIIAILAVTLPLSYGYYPALMTIALTIFVALSILLISVTKLKKKIILNSMSSSLLKLKIKFVTIVIVFLLVGELSVLMYYVAQPTLKSCRLILNKLSLFWSSWWSQEITIRKQLLTHYWIPPILNNSLNVLVRLRDFIIYLFAVIGLIVLLFSFIKSILKRDSDTQFMFKLNLVLIITVYTFAWVVFVNIVQVFINLVIYFLVPLSAFTYYWLLSITVTTRYRAIAVILFIILFAVPIIVAGLSLWSHRVLLQYYYDPSISLTEAGDHNPLYVYMSYFIKKYLTLDSTRKVYTDDPALACYVFKALNLDIIVRPCYNSITVSKFLSSNDSILVLLLDKYLLSGFYGWNTLNIASLYREKVKMILILDKQSNLIYNLQTVLSTDKIKIYASVK